TDRFIYTTARTIDLNHYQLGRPDRVQAMNQTPVSMSFTGMAAWGDLDDIQMTIANLGFLDSPLQYAVDLPAPGATSIMDAQFDWRDTVDPWLVSPDKGDHVIFSQLSTLSVGDMPYLSLTRSATSSMLS